MSDDWGNKFFESIEKVKVQQHPLDVIESIIDSIWGSDRYLAEEMAKATARLRKLMAKNDVLAPSRYKNIRTPRVTKLGSAYKIVDRARLRKTFIRIDSNGVIWIVTHVLDPYDLSTHIIHSLFSKTTLEQVLSVLVNNNEINVKGAIR